MRINSVVTTALEGWAVITSDTWGHWNKREQFPTQDSTFHTWPEPGWKPGRLTPKPTVWPTQPGCLLENRGQGFYPVSLWWIGSIILVVSVLLLWWLPLLSWNEKPFYCHRYRKIRWPFFFFLSTIPIAESNVDYPMWKIFQASQLINSNGCSDTFCDFVQIRLVRQA